LLVLLMSAGLVLLLEDDGLSFPVLGAGICLALAASPPPCRPVPSKMFGCGFAASVLVLLRLGELLLPVWRLGRADAHLCPGVGLGREELEMAKVRFAPFFHFHSSD